ncbi:hypothetical protein SAMN00768000_2221 [Sulfobacillus thermosulfidooxidans DSM 9293]|uniref:Probable membrane transporter protein n=1 Tax=Sulfobacillus thermosulfidooxidans (strain DSM 9293 / VKM B-1269 / AT-1) TaxID=929705 RepID=A0A1W1WGH5_SULTA|nr:sulfite exporter TauE/SafE family protein [Sulfobacillus thermosulfidooxidans]SMC05394.1 hypothetical protein SAMN00768000_2221 [Sulfobacillus thermosulfidooxidans DSM 9293]
MHLGYLSIDSYLIAFLIVLAAFAIRGMLGFGSGLISVSLLIFFLPIKEVVPIVFLLDGVASLALGSYDFKEIRWQEMPWLWIFTIFGLIVGAWILKTLPAQSVTVLLGVFILLYVIYAIVTKPERLPQVSRVWGAPLGFLGGVIGSLYGGGGPSIVAYFQMRHLDKRAFRASFQFIAITDSIVRGSLYFLLGLLGAKTVITSAWLVPAVAIGLIGGNFLHFRIDARRFQYLVLLVLAFAGIKLVIP